MLASCRKLLRVPVTHRKAFCSYGVIAQNFNPKECYVYSESEVKKPDFEFFNVHNCNVINSGEGWVDYVDNNGTEFRMARYVNPPKGWVSLSIDGCTVEDPDTLHFPSELMVGNGAAAAVKRSDQGILLNSCAVKLEFMDILTAKCEGAYYGMLMSDADEKVQLCTDSMEVKDLLLSSEGPPKACRDMVSEMRSLIYEKHRQGGVVDVKIVDSIANYLAERMAELPYQDWWLNPEKEPLFFNKLEDLNVQELKTIVLEDMAGTPRFAKIYEEQPFEGWYKGNSLSWS